MLKMLNDSIYSPDFPLPRVTWTDTSFFLQHKGNKAQHFKPAKECIKCKIVWFSQIEVEIHILHSKYETVAGPAMQVLQKAEYDGVKIFKVVLECQKRGSELKYQTLKISISI